MERVGIANTIYAVVDHITESSVSKFFKEIFDTVHELCTGQKYFHKLSRNEQDMLVFMKESVKEVRDGEDYITHSGIYSLKDAKGVEGAYGAAKVNGRIIVYQYTGVDFDDMRYADQETIDSLHRSVICGWTESCAITVCDALENTVVNPNLLDRVGLPAERERDVYLQHKADLASWIHEEVGETAIKQPRLGAEHNGKLNVYFMIPGDYSVMTFRNTSWGLAVTTSGDAKYHHNVGVIAGLATQDVRDILNEAVTK